MIRTYITIQVLKDGELYAIGKATATGVKLLTTATTLDEAKAQKLKYEFAELGLEA